ncbi:MAG: DUF5131 family protein [Bacteroidetes bacterium]|nr:DUF5131 family protein [Bacteroidota bacterium]
MNKTNIEFCDFTWNPIVGCRHGCSYCWARGQHDRFYYPEKFEMPRFYPNRLKEPYQRKKPAKIFVCSMADIFSPGVKDEWIHRVLKVVADNPQHTFQFLSKKPARYHDFDFPLGNTWIGTSVDYARHADRIDQLVSCGCKFISFVLVEPLLSSMEGIDFSGVDFLFVGAQTGPDAVIPSREWIYSIKHHHPIYKENIRKFL